jgi:hypothetical protein
MEECMIEAMRRITLKEVVIIVGFGFMVWFV